MSLAGCLGDLLFRQVQIYVRNVNDMAKIEFNGYEMIECGLCMDGWSWDVAANTISPWCEQGRPNIWHNICIYVCAYVCMYVCM